nr:hypothetical protein [Candidatus Sigynarchaeota archaeon]
MNRALLRVLRLSVVISFLVGIASVFSALHGMALNNEVRGQSGLGSPMASELPPAAFPGKMVFVSRSMTLDDFGIFYTKDVIILQNTDSEPIQTFYICLNETQTSQLYEMYARSMAGDDYLVEAQPFKLNGFNAWKITFPAPLMPGVQMNFTVWQYFHGAARFITNNTVNGVIYHGVYTITPYYTDTIMSTITLPISTSIHTFLPDYGKLVNTQITFSNQNATPFYTQLMYVDFANPNLVVVETERSTVTIEATSLHDWEISDDVTITNLGLQNLNSLTFIVPEDAYEFSAKDFIGIIMGVTNTSVVGDYKNLTISLLENRYAITTNNKFGFTLSFKLPLANRLIAGDAKNAIIIDIFHVVRNPWIMRNVQVRIAFPQATSIDFNILNMVPDSVDNQDGIQYFMYSRAALSPTSSKILTVIYDYSSFDMQLRPLLITLVVGLLATFFIIARKISMQYQKPTTELAPTEVPLDALKEFVSIFEEKVSIFIDLDTLNDDFKRRKIKKREYQIKIEEMTHRLKVLDNQIKVSKRKLTEFGGRFKEIIEELDLLEAERQSIQDSLLLLEKRYKDGQIKSRQAYEQLEDNYITRLKKIQTAIDSGTNELKSYYS